MLGCSSRIGSPGLSVQHEHARTVPTKRAQTIRASFGHDRKVSLSALNSSNNSVGIASLHTLRSQQGVAGVYQLWAPHKHRVVITPAAAVVGHLADDGDRCRHAEKHGRIYDAEIWSVALPALATMLLDPFIGVVNASMIGKLGTQQLGAVSIAGMTISFATFLFSFLLFLTTPEIAAAHVKGDKDEVSRISSKGAWVAMFFGLIATAVLVLGNKQIIGLMAPPEPAVVQYAAEYVFIRAWAIPASLIGFVATGTFRGFKDTRTPLFAAAGSAFSSLIFNYMFIHVFQWGVPGSAFAVVLSQLVSVCALCGLLLAKGKVQVKHLMEIPSLVSILPMLRKGLVLGFRNVVSFGMVLYASTLCVRAGSTYQAAFEVIRQVWLLTIQFFECLNVATQTLAATYLGQGDRKSAREVIGRLLQLGVYVGIGVGVVVWVLQAQIATFFTKDPTVITQVMLALPLVCFMFPMDAAACIMDGSLLASKQTDYMSYVQIVGSAVQYVMLAYMAQNGMVDSLTIWGVLKVMTLFRFFGGYWRNMISQESGYADLPAAAVAEGTATAVSQSNSPTAETSTSSHSLQSTSQPVDTIQPVSAQHPSHMATTGGNAQAPSPSAVAAAAAHTLQAMDHETPSSQSSRSGAPDLEQDTRMAASRAVPSSQVSSHVGNTIVVLATDVDPQAVGALQLAQGNLSSSDNLLHQETALMTSSNNKSELEQSVKV